MLALGETEAGSDVAKPVKGECRVEAIDALLAEAETSKDRPLAAVAEVGRAAGITTKAVQQRWGPSR
jgi:hypothetical protein